MNFLLFSLAAPDLDWTLDLADYSESDALEISRQLSAWTKEYGYNAIDPRLTELHSLFGYMVYGEYDFEKAARELGDSGKDPHRLHGIDIAEIISDYYNYYNSEPTVKLPSFKEYIESGTWVKQGSASLGYESIEVERETFKVKLRKNMVPYFYTLDELIKLALSSPYIEDNRAFVKPELAKRRIAVAGSLASFLRWDYIMLAAGKFYSLPGNVMVDAQPEETLAFTSIICGLLAKGYYGSSADFEKYDHQINELELLSMGDTMCSKAVNNAANQSDIPAIAEMCKTSLRNSRLLVTPPEGRGKHEEYIQVKATVQSGIRPTSAFGNMYSAVVAAVLMAIYDVICFDLGDDILIIGRRDEVVQATAAIEAMGLRLSVGKFGIVKQSVEFLRVVYTPTKAQGYLCRALPGITQRKPWNNDPPQRDYILKRQCDTIATLLRRGAVGTMLERVVLLAWSKRTKASVNWARLPTSLGGLGAAKFLGMIPDLKDTLTTHIPNIKVSVPPSDGLAIDIEKVRLQSYDIHLTTEEAKDTTDASFESILTGSGIPRLVRAYREAEGLRRYPQARWHSIKPIGLEVPLHHYHLLDFDYKYTPAEEAREALAKRYAYHKNLLITNKMKMKKSIAMKQAPDLRDYYLQAKIPSLEFEVHPIISDLLAQHLWTLYTNLFAVVTPVRLAIGLLFMAQLERASAITQVPLLY
jgi:hypothetical protein